MQRLVVGKISQLYQESLPEKILARAPDGPRRRSWIAGRILLLRMLSPTMVFFEEYQSAKGKPYFVDPNLPYFNISHSGDYIACFMSNVGEVGCDIEAIRPRKNYLLVAQEFFTEIEYQQLLGLDSASQLKTFWTLWTQKEARLKQEAKSIWELKRSDGLIIDQQTFSFFFNDLVVVTICGSQGAAAAEIDVVIDL